MCTFIKELSDQTETIQAVYQKHQMKIQCKIWKLLKINRLYWTWSWKTVDSLLILILLAPVYKSLKRMLWLILFRLCPLEVEISIDQIESLVPRIIANIFINVNLCLFLDGELQLIIWYQLILHFPKCLNRFHLEVVMLWLPRVIRVVFIVSV